MPDARKFSRARHRIKLVHRDVVEERLRRTIRDVLREEDPTAMPGAVDVIAHLAAVIASQLTSQPQSNQRSIKALGEEVVDYGAAFVEEIVREAKKDIRSRIKKVVAAAPPAAGDLPLADDWAGPVAGPTMIERHFGIPRSTLYRWQKRNEVVWLNTRTSRKPVFPLRQFVDGRPAEGIAEVVQAFGDARKAWRWLVEPGPSGAAAQRLEQLLAGDSHGIQDALRSIHERRLGEVSKV